MANSYRRLPSVDRVLADERLRRAASELGLEAVTEAVRVPVPYWHHSNVGGTERPCRPDPPPLAWSGDIACRSLSASPRSKAVDPNHLLDGARVSA